MSFATLEQELPAAIAPPQQPILIVDDDDALVDVLKLRLERQGFTTRTSATGASALDIARRHQPSLILLDVRLPDIDGFELCQQLVDDPQTADIPVIILSGMERPDIIRRARGAGCHFFIRKPYDPNALLALIQQALDADDSSF